MNARVFVKWLYYGYLISLIHSFVTRSVQFESWNSYGESVIHTGLLPWLFSFLLTFSYGLVGFGTRSCCCLLIYLSKTYPILKILAFFDAIVISSFMLENHASKMFCSSLFPLYPFDIAELVNREWMNTLANCYKVLREFMMHKV